MYIFGSVGIIDTILRWLSIIFLSSVINGIVSVNGGHHHNKVRGVFTHELFESYLKDISLCLLTLNCLIVGVKFDKI